MEVKPQYECHIYSATQTPADLKQQYFNLRYQCFEPNDPNLNMDTINKIEHDKFDKVPITTYIMVIEKKQDKIELMSAVRWIPTTEEYELQQASYNYLTKNTELPASHQICEGSRWVGKSSRTKEGQQTTSLLMKTLCHDANRRGFNKMIGVIADISGAWMNKRSTHNVQKGEKFYSDRDSTNLSITTISLDESFIATAERLAQPEQANHFAA